MEIYSSEGNITAILSVTIRGGEESLFILLLNMDLLDGGLTAQDNNDVSKRHFKIKAVILNAPIMHGHTRMMIIIINYHIYNIKSYKLNIDLAVVSVLLRMGHMAPSGRSG